MSNDKKEEIGLGDLEKTVIVNALMETPFEQRDTLWIDAFLKNIDGANLKLSQPEVILATDGYPYIQLETVKSDKSFQAFVIDQQLPSILGQGFGIVINAKNQTPDWVFTYGDIVNYELNDEFYTNESPFSTQTENVAITPDEKILIGQPSEAILPKYLKKQLREFLVQFGVKTPKTMLLARNYEDEQQVTQDLVFNFTPTQFATEEAFKEVMRTLAWFMPRHYSFFCIDEMSIENGFELI